MEKAGAIAGILIIMSGFFFLMTAGFQYCWNYLVPVFHQPSLTYIQACALLACVGIVGSVLKSNINVNKKDD